MEFAPFATEFPGIAREETRQITVLDNDGALPQGRYLLMELFCKDPECDCRRVFFNVRYVEENQLVAVIAYGWEDMDFYREWLGYDKPELIDELQGPTLNKASPQTDLAPALLNQVETVLNDEDYVDRIKRHYRMFKDSIAKDDKQSN